MENLINTAFAFPLVILGALFIGSIYLAFCEHLKSSCASSIIMFVATLIISDVSVAVAGASIVGYFILGVIWSSVRWKSHNIKSIEKLELINKDFNAGKLTAAEAQEKSDSVRLEMKIAENKERIACWILGFIPSFIFHFAQDLVLHLKELVVTHLSSIYARITKKYSEKAESFQYETNDSDKSVK